MIVVVAAVIERDGRLLVTQRMHGTHLSGRWEFPGGKTEPGEPLDAALRRELAEELGVTARIGAEILSVEHAYPERTVRLHFFACEIDGTPHAMLGQAMRWVTRDDLGGLEWPEADAELIRILQSPR